MEFRSLENFSYELEQVREKLTETGRPTEDADMELGTQGLTCDFDLPYSSLPRIQAEKWK